MTESITQQSSGGGDSRESHWLADTYKLTAALAARDHPLALRLQIQKNTKYPPF
ncbi:hypothetical protein ACWGH1_07635 [Streptomyces sp. NPDC054883]